MLRRVVRGGVWLGAWSLAACSCAAPTPSPPAAPSRSEPAQADTPTCQAAAELDRQALRALEEGSWLRARSLATRAGLGCRVPSATLDTVEARLRADTRESRALFELARAARTAGELRQAREAESSAVARLERDQGARLTLAPRWAFGQPVWDKNGQFLVLPSVERLSVLDPRTGELKLGIPRPNGSFFGQPNSDFATEFNAGTKLFLVRTLQDRCHFEIGIYDAASGALRKSVCGREWAVGADGTRLALAEILGFGDGAVMAVLILDARTLELIVRLPPPPLEDGSAASENISRMVLGPDGRTLAVTWSRAVSLIDLAQGTQLAHRGDWPSELTFSADGRRAAFSDGNTVATWDVGSPAPTVWPLAHCADIAFALDPAGGMLAVGCDDSVRFIDARTGRELGRVPMRSRAFSLSWVAGARGLLVDEVIQSTSNLRLLDVARRRWVSFEPGVKLRSVAAGAALAMLDLPKHGWQLIGFDATMKPKALELGCTVSPDRIFERPGEAAVLCWGTDRSEALLFDARTLALRRVPAGGQDLALVGDRLVGVSPQAVELRALDTGKLLPFSPISPESLRPESWWEGHTLVVNVEDSSIRRRVDFGEELKVSTEDPASDERCGPNSEHEGPIDWLWGPPYTICNRRDGTVLGNLPVPAAGLARFAHPDVTEDAARALLDEDEPHLFDVANGREIALRDPPARASFVGNDVLIGPDITSTWGVWSATDGRRLARWPSAPSVEPLAAHTKLGLTTGQMPQRPLELFDLWSGKRLEVLPVASHGKVHFLDNGVLSVVEAVHVSFWRVPRATLLGRYFSHPETGAALFIAGTGEFEVSGDAAGFENLLRCAVGSVEAPYQTCVDALREPGIAARVLDLAGPAGGPAR